MPIYVFKCSLCQHTFEKITSVDRAFMRCPKCKKLVAKIPSVPAPFQWGKSGGWK